MARLHNLGALRGAWFLAFLASLLGNSLGLLVALTNWRQGSFGTLLAGDALNVGVLGYLFYVRERKVAAGVGLGYVIVFLFTSLLALLT